MSTGVLLYCFDTPEVAYHRLAEKCVQQIKKYLKLEITIVTDIATYKKFKPMGFINYKLVEPQKGNRRVYREKSISWHNMERAMAWDHSPYDTTILMDCDYFVFSDTPDIFTVIGVLIIIICGIYVFLGEHKQNINSSKIIRE